MILKDVILVFIIVLLIVLSIDLLDCYLDKEPFWSKFKTK